MNKDEQIINSREMILKVFTNIDKKRFEQKDSIENAWKKILTSIKSTTSKEDIGSKLFYHSSIIDIKDGLLLIETDHSGFIQLFKIHEKYIINGLTKFIPQMGIKNLSFRLKGSTAVFAEKKLLNQKQEQTAVVNKFKKEEQELDNFYKNNKNLNLKTKKENINQDKNSEIPEKMKEAFDRMKKTMLTKS